MKEYNKKSALEYLVKNNVASDEWSSAGMYEALEVVILSKEDIFKQDYLDELLENASDF